LAALTGHGNPDLDTEAEDLPLYARAEFGLASTVSAEPRMVSSGLHAAERRLGVTFASANSYINFDTTWSDKQAGWNKFAAEGRTLVVAWAPIRHSQSVLLSEVAAGRYADHVDEVLSGIAEYPHRVVCRWAWEMNGDWAEYSAAYQGESKGCFDPSEYIQAWRYVVDRSRALRVSNLLWLFCPNGTDVGPYPMEQYWPGQDYVDLVGADAYNGFAGWTSFHDLFAGPYRRLTQLKPATDFWVGETGCVESTTASHSKAEWAHSMFHERRLPRVRAVNYFDDYGSRDWRIHTSEESQAAFTAGFLLANQAQVQGAPG